MFRSRYRADPGDSHFVGDWRYCSLCRRGKLRVVLSLRRKCPHVQWEEKGRRKYQERKPFSGLGVCRSCQFRDPLLRSRSQILSTEESQAKRHRGHQSGGPQARTRLLPHVEEWRSAVAPASINRLVPSGIRMKVEFPRPVAMWWMSRQPGRQGTKRLPATSTSAGAELTKADAAESATAANGAANR